MCRKGQDVNKLNLNLWILNEKATGPRRKIENDLQPLTQQKKDFTLMRRAFQDKEQIRGDQNFEEQAWE